MRKRSCRKHRRRLIRPLRLKREEMYLDWFNNFLTVQCFADYYGITKREAESLIHEFRTR